MGSNPIWRIADNRGRRKKGTYKECVHCGSGKNRAGNIPPLTSAKIFDIIFISPKGKQVTTNQRQQQQCLISKVLPGKLR